LRAIFLAGVAAVDPARLVAGAVATGARGGVILGLGGGAGAQLRGRIGVLGAGKASVPMAAGLEEACDGLLDLAGTVISPATNSDKAGKLSTIRVLFGNHPVPGVASAESTARLIGDLTARGAVDHYVCLISGGASSLLIAPIAPLTLREKRRVTELLLEGGVPIGEVNTVRKHLSTVKGGRILRLVGGRPVTTLILSDVVGDDPATIGSGPTVPDSSTYREAIDVLKRHDLLARCPSAALAVLERGARGDIPETVRPWSREGRLATPLVVGSNATALAASAAEATRRGYQVTVHPTPLTGDTVRCATDWVRDVLRGSAQRGGGLCWLAGGETTVRVVGDGKGGRNQEFALALVDALEGTGVSVLSAGTDGIDGPTEAAGAFVDDTSRARAVGRGMDPSSYLRNNDSFNFFRELGDTFTTGPTATNVMDLKVALVRAASGH
jgi:hydroxypyruvate reductase